MEKQRFQKHNMSLKIILFGLAILLNIFAGIILFGAGKANAQAVSTISYQGKIVNKVDGTNFLTGAPACVQTGADTCDFRVRIYNMSSGGTLLFEEEHVNIEIGDTNGIYTLQINSVCADWAGGCAGSGVDWTDGISKYIQLEFDPSGNADYTEGETFARTLITSVPYSYYSDNASQLGGLTAEEYVYFAAASAQTTGDVTTALIHINENGAGTPNFAEFEVGGSDIFIITNDGKVGLGTTPTALLDIMASTSSKAQINFTSGANVSAPVSGDLWFDGTNLKFYNGTSTFNLGTASGYWTESAGLVYLTTTTNDFAVGGTSLASSIFSIDESTGNFNIAADNSANPTFNFEATDGDQGVFGISEHSTAFGNMSFYLTNANVGIGTISADQALDVSGNIQLTGNLLPSAAPTYTAITQTSTAVDTSSASMGQYTSIAIGLDGLPIISYWDVTNTALRVTKCGNQACSSGNTATTVDDTGTSTGQYTSIAVPSDGLPVISYYDVTDADLEFVKCGDSACSSGNTLTTIDSTGSVGTYTSLALGFDGFPIISYGDGTNADLKVTKCGNATCSSGNTSTAVDTSLVNPATYTSITIGGDGLPIISYHDSFNADLKVVRCGNAACSSGNTITAVDTTNSVGQYTSIAIGTDELPIISHYDTTNTALRAVKCGNTSCSAGNTLTTVDNTGTETGQFTHIKIGADGLPMISQYVNTTQDLKVVKCGNQACSTGNTLTTVESTGNVGQHNYLEIGADGLPLISFRDVTNGDLKVLKCSDHACTATAVGYPTGGSDIGSREKYFKDVFATRYYGKSYNINNFDVAEEYEVDDMTIEAGDVVRFKPDGSQLKVEKAGGQDRAYDKEVVGVISTEPGLYLKDWEAEKANGRPVALVGRVPVKVSTENGPIKRGDYLTASSTPGVAMKASKEGYIVGRAMEDFAGLRADSLLVKEELQEQTENAEEVITLMVENGLANENEAGEMTAVVEEAVDNSSSFGRIMMYVDLGYVDNAAYGELGRVEKALTVDNFTLTSGENIIKLSETKESNNLTLNLSSIIVSGALEVQGDLKVGGKLVAKSVEVKDIKIAENINAPKKKGTIAVGVKEVVIDDANVKTDSLIYFTMSDFVKYKVTKVDAGRSFTIEISEPAEREIKFEYLIL